MTKHYVLFIEGDVEPNMHGPYNDPEQSTEAARKLRREHGKDSGGLYALSIDVLGIPSIDSFSGATFEDIDYLEDQRRHP